MHKATFLSYRPSQIASTAILVAIDLNKNDKYGSATCRASSIKMDSFEQQSSYQSNAANTGSRSSSRMLVQDEYDLRVKNARAQSNAVSPRGNFKMKEVNSSTPKANVKVHNSATSETQTIEKAWTR